MSDVYLCQYLTQRTFTKIFAKHCLLFSKYKFAMKEAFRSCYHIFTTTKLLLSERGEDHKGENVKVTCLCL